MVTARTTPEYLICWLAVTALGAVVVSVNPRSAPAELAGLAQQTRPRALITDPGLARLVTEAGVAGLLPLGVLDAGELAGDWAHASPGSPARGEPGGGEPGGGLPGAACEPRRPRGTDPHVRHDGPVQAGHADPPGLRPGRGGIPVLDGADRAGPADDLAAAVPHQRPGLLGDGLAGLWRGPDPAAPLLRERLPGRGAAARRDRVQRDRRDAGDPDAPAAARGGRGHPAAALLHGPGAGPGTAGGDGEPVRPAHRGRVRDVGESLRPDLAARDPPVRHPRRGPPASGSRRDQPRAGGRRRGPGGRPGRDR